MKDILGKRRLVFIYKEGQLIDKFKSTEQEAKDKFNFYMKKAERTCKNYKVEII